MPQDAILDEIRAIRDAYAKQFDYDLDAIFRDLKEMEARSDRPRVSFSPKRIAPEKQPVELPRDAG